MVDRDAEIIYELVNDARFSFKKRGDMLRDGRCPDCNRKSVWTSIEKPGRIWCNHESSCGFTESTRALYPELFENYAERFPATPDDPRATARAYLQERGFNTGVIAKWYDQGTFPLGNNNWAPTVRINLADGFYWERLIDKAHIKKAGRKNSYKKGFKKLGQHWQPPGFELNDGDTCVITEGIFNAWVFLHNPTAKYKAIAGFDCNNLPVKLIEANRNKNITWMLAYDNDPAGLKHLPEHIETITALGETVQVMLTRGAADWNDEFLAGRINDKYLSESLWRGQFALSETAQEKAFWLWVRRPRKIIMTDFGNALFRYKVDDKSSNELNEALDNEQFSVLWNDPRQDIDYAQVLFASAVAGERISNCNPKFLYIERNTLTEEQRYFFRLAFRNGNQPMLVQLDGSNLESPASFNKALLGKTPGGTFDGQAADMKMLKEGWFDKTISEIQSFFFLGYSKETKTYVFPEFGFANGRLIDVNDHGFIDTGSARVKTAIKNIKIRKGKLLDESWIQRYHQVFHTNGMIVMAWWLGTLFAEQIRAKHESWPFMELTGEPGAGKTTLIRFLWRCCGINDYEGFDPNKGTQVGRARNLMRHSNLPVVMVEGDREKDSKRGAFDFNELKDFYNGGIVRTMGVKNQGTDTIEPPFRGGMMIAQNATIDADKAVLERIVHCHATKTHYTKESVMAARELTALSTDDLAGFMLTALAKEDEILKVFDAKLGEIETQWRTSGTDIRQRIIECHAKIAACVWCLQLLFPKNMTNDVCSVIESSIWARSVDRERRVKNDHPMVEQFWEYYDLLNWQQRDWPDGSFETVETLNHSKNPDLIAINLPEFERACGNNRLERLPMNELKKLLPTGQAKPFTARKAVNSKIRQTNVSCWVFKDSQA